MAPFAAYNQAEDGSYTFQRDDGSWTPALPPTPATFMAAKGVDMRLAQAPPGAGGMGGDPSEGSRAMPSPSMSDAAPDYSGASAGGAPGYTPGPAPRDPAALQSQEPAGVGGAPGRYGQGAGAAGGAGPVPVVEEPPPAAPPDGGGGAMGAPAAPPAAPPAAAAAPVQAGLATGGKVDPSQLVSAKPAPKVGGGGGGGAPAGPRELLAGRQVSIEGKWSPQTKAEAEAVIRGKGALDQRAYSRDLERQELGRQQDEVIDRLGQKKDEPVRDARADQERILGELQQRRQAKLAEIEGAQIDPDKFFKDAGTRGQIAAGLGIAFGAIGAGMTGRGDNQALSIIQGAIDRDINAQEKNLGKKQWEAGELGRIYALEKERTGDAIAARLETKAAALAQVKEQAKRLAAISNSEDVAIKAQQLQLQTDAQIAALHQQADDRIKEALSYKTVMPGGGGGAPKKKTAGGFVIRDPKSGKDRYVEFPAGLSEGQKNDVFKRVQGINNAQRTLGRLTEARGAGLPIADEDAQAFAQSFTYEYAEGKGQGQATADQEKSVAAKVRGPMGYKAIDAYAKNLDDSSEELLRQFSKREEE